MIGSVGLLHSHRGVQGDQASVENTMRPEVETREDEGDSHADHGEQKTVSVQEVEDLERASADAHELIVMDKLTAG